MKLLILSNCNNSNPINLEDCMTRNELFILLLKFNLNNFDNVELFTGKCNPRLCIKHNRYSNGNKFPFVDHTLFIDDYGFRKRHDTFINEIKKTTKCSISTLVCGEKFSTIEDITFVFGDKTSDNKLTFIKPPLDEYIYAPRKDKNIIYILLEKPFPLMNRQDNDMHFVLPKIQKLILKNNGNDLIFKIGIISKNSVDFIDMSGDVVETKSFDMYIDFIYEISKANIFILTNKCIDTYFLYELAMCNTLIISKVNLIDKCTCDNFKIYTYHDKLKWDDIFGLLLAYDARQFLLNNDHTWNNMIKSMIDKFEASMTTSKELTLHDSTEKTITNFNKLNNKICTLNIKDKHNPHICIMQHDVYKNETINAKNIQSNQSTQINQTGKRPKVFLQSQLLRN